MPSIFKSRTVTRRAVVSGAGSLLATSALPLSAIASMTPMPTSSGPGGRSGRRRPGAETLAGFLCERTHPQIAANLDAVIADPAIDGEQTALALMEARCPGCRQRVSPATSSLSAVIPQWKPVSVISA